MFFSNFPLIEYRFGDDKSSPLLMTHILRRFKFNTKIKELVSEWTYYEIQENETPEMVAMKFYNDPTLHWVILMFNDIIDPFTDWPIPSESMNEYATKLFEDINDIHHWELGGRAVPANTPNSIPVKNIVFLERVNEFNRRIKVPKQIHIGPILKEVEMILTEAK